MQCTKIVLSFENAKVYKKGGRRWEVKNLGGRGKGWKEEKDEGGRKMRKMVREGRGRKWQGEEEEEG